MALTKVSSSGLDTNAITSDKITANSITEDKIANSAVTLNKIASDSITEAKIADTAIENEHLNTNIITGQTELSETAADGDFLIIFDTSTSSLKKILKSNISPTAPTVTSVSPTNVDSVDGSTNFTITGTGFTAGSTARLIGASGQVKEFTTVVRNSTTQITGTIDVSNLDEAQTPYGVQVTNGSGVSALLASQIDVNQAPAFVTASGSLGNTADTSRATKTYTIEATDPESTSAVQYEISSGSLPTGMSLNQTTGVISGTADAVGSDTTSNFTIRAYDSGSNVSTRSFSITVLAPVTQSFTTSGTFSVPAGVTAVDVLVVGGGGGSRSDGGGAGAGGLIYRPGFSVTPGGTITVTVGCGGSADNSGQDTVFSTLTAKGGGASNTPGGSGGGAGRDGGGGRGNATQPTQPGDSGAYGFGNQGGVNTVPSGGWIAGSGGGGAGAAGTDATSYGPGNGQDGQPGRPGGIGLAYSISGTSVYYAGGGGGSARGLPGGTGGQGGGSNGTGPGDTSQPGTANRGGGAGAPQNNPGASGGKGIVIVQY